MEYKKKKKKKKKKKESKQQKKKKKNRKKRTKLTQKKRHSSDEIIKLYFSENNSSLTNRIAIDIENYEIYIDPLMSARGLDTLDGTTDLEDAEKLIKMLDLYDVLEWKREYNLHATES